MISLRGVDKSFGTQTVLKDFNLDIPDGARIAIMGRSGAGKTTLLNIITGLMKPDRGSVTLPRGLRFGAVFQEDRLIEPLSAVSNCRLVQNRSEDISKISVLLDSLGIGSGLAEKPVSELSGGERRRVAIARAILSCPDVFILDEPFKGIDQKTLPKVIEILSDAIGGATLILVTHSSDEATALSCKIKEIS